MLMTTTDLIEGKTIVEYKGLVFGEVVAGANIIRDFFAGIRDIVGGRSGSYEAKLSQARQDAINEMLRNANKLGANAVIGVDVRCETLGSKGGMFMIVASGTAVVLRT